MVYIPWAGYNPKWQQDQRSIIVKVYKPKAMKEGNHPHPKSVPKPKTKSGFKPMTSCFEFRNRTVSFDLHNIGQSAKMSLLSKLLHRSKSESSMKVPPKNHKHEKGNSTSLPSLHSPKSSPGATPRRRFVRVVRDDQCIGEEYVNPHVMRRFSKKHWEQHYLKKSASLDDSDVDPCRPLPYTVTGHTILKKHHSVDAEALCAESQKHAKFKEEVEVLEYDIKGKILAIHSDASILHAKLHDGEFIHDEVVLSREECDAISIGSLEVELATPSSVTLEVISETDSPDTLSPDSDTTETTVLTECTTVNSDSDVDADDLLSDSIDASMPEMSLGPDTTTNMLTNSDHMPKASRQISAEDEATVKKTKLENGQIPKRMNDTAVSKATLATVQS